MLFFKFEDKLLSLLPKGAFNEKPQKNACQDDIYYLKMRVLQLHKNFIDVSYIN